MGNTNQVTQERRKRESRSGGYAAELAEVFDAVTMELKHAIGWPRFEMGRLTIGRQAEKRLEPGDVIDGTMRHGFCDWGVVCERRARWNEEALHGSGTLVSRYRSASGVPFWVITRRGRSATSVLLSQDRLM